jgi:molybdenum cofactor synthesis domain-containing protein
MSLRFAILTASDRSARGERPDLSGPALAELVTAQGWTVVRMAILPDDLNVLRETLSIWADRGGLDIILVTGGTGFAPRDVTPEATRAVIQREAPGLAEAMRSATFGANPHGMLSRGVAGIAGATVVLNLPGSVAGVEESLAVVGPALRHACELLAGGASDHGIDPG